MAAPSGRWETRTRKPPIMMRPTAGTNEEGLQFPLIPRLRAVLEQQHERKLAIERATNSIAPWLFFFPDGRRIKNFRGGRGLAHPNARVLRGRFHTTFGGPPCETSSAAGRHGLGTLPIAVKSAS